jgi:DNA-binding YbaB/EbfC family protein
MDRPPLARLRLQRAEGKPTLIHQKAAKADDLRTSAENNATRAGDLQDIPRRQARYGDGARAIRPPCSQASASSAADEPPPAEEYPVDDDIPGKRVLMFDKLKDLGGLMQQAQQMQQKMQELQAALERLEIVGSSGAGLVKVTVNGKNETRRIEIDASLFKPEDKGVVEDLIVAAANDARSQGRADRAGADARASPAACRLPPGFKI